MSKNILVLPGDGIGQEIVTEAVKVRASLLDYSGLDLNIDESLLGGAAYTTAMPPPHEAHLRLPTVA